MDKDTLVFVLNELSDDYALEAEAESDDKEMLAFYRGKSEAYSIASWMVQGKE